MSEVSQCKFICQSITLISSEKVVMFEPCSAYLHSSGIRTYQGGISERFQMPARRHGKLTIIEHSKPIQLAQTYLQSLSKVLNHSHTHSGIFDNLSVVFPAPQSNVDPNCTGMDSTYECNIEIGGGGEGKFISRQGFGFTISSHNQQKSSFQCCMWMNGTKKDRGGSTYGPNRHRPPFDR